MFKPLSPSVYNSTFFDLSTATAAPSTVTVTKTLSGLCALHAPPVQSEAGPTP